MTTLNQTWLNIMGACHQAYKEQWLEAPLYGLYNLILSGFLQACMSKKGRESIYLNPQHTLLPDISEEVAQSRGFRRRTPDFTGVIAPVPANLRLSQVPSASPGMLEALTLVFGAEVKPLREQQPSQPTRIAISWENTADNILYASESMFSHFDQLLEQAIVSFNLKKIKEKNTLYVFLLVGVFFSLHRFELGPPDPVKAGAMPPLNAVDDQGPPPVTPVVKKRRLRDRSQSRSPSPPRSRPVKNDEEPVLKRTLVVATASIFGSDSMDSFSDEFKYALNLCATHNDLVYMGTEFNIDLPLDPNVKTTWDKDIKETDEMWKRMAKDQLDRMENEQAILLASPATSAAGTPYRGRQTNALPTTPAATRNQTRAREATANN
ncbi:hypothetical protein C8R47DRAFT_677505 [Mycena vitilis]|nr:hypothetical protein C8R47DRAFT_677505 [Mycena vitilis]